MILRLYRKWLDKTCTIGELFIDDRPGRECYILEPPVREVPGKPVEKWKVDGHTAIPKGTYKIERRFSPKHGQVVPWLCGIPGFENVEIHSGNTAVDTKGCLLPGLYKGADNDSVTESVVAFIVVDVQIKAAAQRGEGVFITVG